MGLGRPRWCSWIVEIAGLGGGALHRQAKAAGRGTTTRPGALIRRNRRPLTRRRRKRIGCSSEGSTTESVSGWYETVPLAEYATRRVPCSEGSRSRADRSERSRSRGKPEDIENQAKAGGPPSSGAPPEVTSFPWFRPGGWQWKPASNAKANEEGDSGIERFTGYTCRVVGCRSRNEASSLPGQGAPRGEPGLDEVA